MGSTAQGLTGYKRALYQSYVTEGIKAGLSIANAIFKARERIAAIPKISIGDDENPLAGDYMNSQREEVSCEKV